MFVLVGRSRVCSEAGHTTGRVVLDAACAGAVGGGHDCGPCRAVTTAEFTACYVQLLATTAGVDSGKAPSRLIARACRQHTSPGPSRVRSNLATRRPPLGQPGLVSGRACTGYSPMSLPGDVRLQLASARLYARRVCGRNGRARPGHGMGGQVSWGSRHRTCLA